MSYLRQHEKSKVKHVFAFILRIKYVGYLHSYLLT